jgi:DNA replication protein DnaC
MKMTSDNSTLSALRSRAQRLGFHGLLAHWDAVATQKWLTTLIEYEEVERSKRSLERRLHHAKLGQFKPLSDFDWNWPKVIDRAAIEELFALSFIEEAANIILVGNNGLGKTMIAKNLVHQALLHGYSACALTASELLNDLAAQESSAALLRRLRHYCRPDILLIDELGYLAISHEHADLLFELVTRRYQKRPIIITTNKIFEEWNLVFPNAGCLLTLIDRLVHKSEVLKIDGKSFRLKEALERSTQKKANRKGKKDKTRK